MIQFYEQTSIFDELFLEFKSYVENTAWEYNETNYEVDFSVPTRSDVNVDVTGTYLIDDELIICDETFSFEYQLVYKDKYKFKTDYFIDEFGSQKSINSKYNNTIFGQYGMDLFFGDSYDPTNLYCPACYFMFNEEKGLSPFETKHNSKLKELLFDIGLVVSGSDVFEQNTSYTRWSYMKKFLYKTIGEYFNNCPEIYDSALRVMEWDYDTKIVEEKRLGDTPFVRSLLINTLTYR